MAKISVFIHVDKLGTDYPKDVELAVKELVKTLEGHKVQVWKSTIDKIQVHHLEQE